MELSEIRIKQAQVKSQLYITRQKEQELYTMYKDTLVQGRDLQKELTSLEVMEAELTGKIEKIGRTVHVKKKVTTLVDASTKEALKQLTKEERESLIASLLEGIS